MVSLLLLLLPCRRHPQLRLPRMSSEWDALQAEAAGLERELELARKQIDIERRKQEEMVKERERWVLGSFQEASHSAEGLQPAVGWALAGNWA